MGVRPTSAMLNPLKELRTQATKLKQHRCLQEIQLDNAAFNDLDKFLRAIRDVGFNLRELRAPKVATFLKAYKQAATHDQWLRRFGVDLVTAFHTQTAQACLDQWGANFSFEDVIVHQHQMDKQPFARWSADMISDFQLNVCWSPSCNVHCIFTGWGQQIQGSDCLASYRACT